MKIAGIFVLLRLAAMTLSGFVMSLGMMLMLSPILTVFWIYSTIVHNLLKLKFGKTFLKAKGLDIIQGFQSTESKPYINAAGRYKGRINIDSYKKKWNDYVLKLRDDKGKLRYRKFSQLFEKHLGYHVFKDDPNFNIDNHFVEVKMRDLFPEKFPPKNNEKNLKNQDPIIKSPYGDVQINMNGFQSTELYTKPDIDEEEDEEIPEIPWEEIVNRLLNKHGSEVIPKSLPQWQIIYVYDRDHTSLIFKVNHAYSDGVYILRLYLETLGDFPVKCNLPYNYHQPEFSKRILGLFWAFCLLPFGLSRLSFKYEENPCHGPALSGDKMYMISKAVQLEDIKMIKKETKTSMSAILFSCMSNAIAHYFKTKFLK